MSQCKSLKTLQVNKVSGSTEPLSVRAGEIRCAKYLNADGTPFAGGGGGDVSKDGSISADYVMLVDPQRIDPGVMLQHGDGVQVDGDTLVISSGRVEELVPQPDNMAVWAAPLDDGNTTNVCSNAAVTLTGDGVKITDQGTYFGSDKYGQINLYPPFKLTIAFTIRFRLGDLFIPARYNKGNFLQIRFPSDDDGTYVIFSLGIAKWPALMHIPISGLIEGTQLVLEIYRIDATGKPTSNRSVLNGGIDGRLCNLSEYVFELNVMCPQGDVSDSQGGVNNSPSACGAQLFINGIPIFESTTYLGDTVTSYNGNRTNSEFDAFIQFINYNVLSNVNNLQYTVRDVAIWNKVMHPEWDRSFVPDTFYRAGMYDRDDVGNVIVQSTLNATPSGVGSLMTSGGVYVGKDVVANGHGFFTQDVQSRGVICTDNSGDARAEIALNNDGNLEVCIARENVCIVPDNCRLVASFTNAPIIDMLYDCSTNEYLYNVIPSAASAGIMANIRSGMTLLNHGTFLQWPLDLGSSSVVLEFEYDPDDESMAINDESQLISVSSCDDPSSSITIYYGCYDVTSENVKKQIKISLKSDSISDKKTTDDLGNGSGRYAVVYSVSSDTYTLSVELYLNGSLIQSWSRPVNSSLSMLFSNKCMLQVGSTAKDTGSESVSGGAFVPGSLKRLTIADLSSDYQYDPSSSVVGWEFEDIHSVVLPSELNVIPPSSVHDNVLSHGALWVQGGAHIERDVLVSGSVSSGSVLSGAVSSQTGDLVLSAGKTIWGVLPADASLIATLKTAAVIDWDSNHCSDIPDDMQPTVSGQVTFDGSTMTIANDSEDIDSSVEWNIDSHYNIISSAFTVRYCTTYDSLGGFFITNNADPNKIERLIDCSVDGGDGLANLLSLTIAHRPRDGRNDGLWLCKCSMWELLEGEKGTDIHMIELDYDGNHGYAAVFIDGVPFICCNGVPNTILPLDLTFAMGFYSEGSFVVKDFVIWNTCKHYTNFSSFSVDKRVGVELEQPLNSVSIACDQSVQNAVNAVGNVTIGGDVSVSGNFTSQGVGTFGGISFPQDPSYGNIFSSAPLMSYYSRSKLVTYRNYDLYLLEERIGDHVTITMHQLDYDPECNVNDLGQGTIDPPFCPSETQQQVYSTIPCNDWPQKDAHVSSAYIWYDGSIGFLDDSTNEVLALCLDGLCFNYGIFDPGSFLGGMGIK